ncbi:protein FAM117B isoform X2 [Zonotrichia leucophrys gambelii]|uniref:protein FAM117B isoform X2 n=1 Tax=Zonotrichia albicollis TaxID=44394 RepID=UPI000EAAECAB|nr:protein FAM117B isoform X2 [Zonotrichia albicollis]
MSHQRVRRGGSPTPATSLAGGGGAAAAGGGAAGASSRLQPMRATVPFQLKQQPQQQHGSPTRSGGGPAAGLPRAAPPGSGGRGGPATAPPGGAGSGGGGASSRGSPTRGHGGARGSPPRHHHLPPPPPGSGPSPCSSPVPPLPEGRVRHHHRRQSPEQGRSSPERKSPSSPVCKDKSRPPSSSPSSIVRRTSSLDTLAAPYLAGQWPRDNHGQAAPCMRDKATQTESAWAEEYLEKKRSSHKRSSSWGSNEQLKEIAKLRQQLQRSKHSSRHHRDKERQSPFHGNHAAINHSQAHIPKNALVPVIPITKSTGSRFRNSVEGLNQEIEIIIKETGDKEEQLVPQDIPDGHRAPPPLAQRSSSTRSIDTQTPGGADKGSNNSSRSQSVSPSSFLTICNEGSEESPCSADDLLGDSRDKENGNNSPLPKYATSPKPNNSYMFKREPPEGCEKVKVFEENLPKPLHEIPAFYCPDKNKVNFIPKSGSAFCLVSILKPLLPTQDLTLKGTTHSLTVSSSMTPGLLQPISMASLTTSTDQDRISRGTSTVIPQSSLLQQPGCIEEAEE